MAENDRSREDTQADHEREVAFWRQRLDGLISTPTAPTPPLVRALDELGRFLLTQGNLTKARNCFEEALKYVPGLTRARCDLASILLDQDQDETAAQHLRQLLRDDPDCLAARLGMARLQTKRGDQQGALAQAQGALLRDPISPDALVQVATNLAALGQRAEAEERFRAALSREPDHADAHIGLAKLLGSGLSDRDIDAMEATLAFGRLPAGRQIPLRFTLAQSYDAIDNYPLAASHVRQANALKVRQWEIQGRVFNPEKARQLTENVMRTFTASFLSARRGWGCDSDVPVFVVGMPRAGKSLVERLLANHPRVTAAGELPLIRHTYYSLGTPGLAGLTFAATNRIATEILRRIRCDAPSGSRVVDTMAGNYAMIGLIRLLFSNAHILHCQRDMRDVALSCWFKDFRGIAWPCRVDSLKAHLDNYRILMAHWRNVAPDAFFEARYEDTVADPQMAAAQLLSYVGLSPAASPGGNETSARDDWPSGPISSRWVGRWRLYVNEFGDLLEAVGGDGAE